MEDQPDAGSFLTDLDIELRLKSSQADVKTLNEFVNVIVTSLQTVSSLDIALIENETKILVQYQKKLTSIRAILQI